MIRPRAIRIGSHTPALLLAAVAAACLAVAAPQAVSQSRPGQAWVEVPPNIGEVRHAGDLAPYYDDTSPSYRQLQRPQQAMEDFPRTSLGEVDWVTAIREGRIEPREGLAEGAEMERLDLDVIMKRTRKMPHVLFPHDVHTEWLSCDNCHDELFERRSGAHRADMNDILEGRSCGNCHDRVAFSSYACDRCHSVPLGDDSAR